MRYVWGGGTLELKEETLKPHPVLCMKVCE